jgi:N-acetylglucosamine kinase-like BadF-type ATPase
MKKFYLGIDAGGTSYDVIAVNTFNKILFKCHKEALHINNVGPENFSNHISDTIKSILKQRKYKLTNCKGICIGVAGARFKKDRKIIRKFLQNLLGINNLIIETDTEIARYGAFGGEDGILLICGTGSILFGKIKNELYRIGGWGKILGDEGSGYKIGLEALKILTKEFDSKIFTSRLAKNLLLKYSITNKNILDKIYRQNFNIQSIAPLVIELAGKKDKDSLGIIKNASSELSKLIEIFFKLTKIKKVNLALSGSLVEKNKFFSDNLKKEIAGKFGDRINIISKKHSPEFGACLIAKNKYEK